MTKREKKRKYIVAERRRLHQLKHPEEEVDSESKIEEVEVMNEEDVTDSLSGYAEQQRYMPPLRNRKPFNFNNLEPDLRNMFM